MILRFVMVSGPPSVSAPRAACAAAWCAAALLLALGGCGVREPEPEAIVPAPEPLYTEAPAPELAGGPVEETGLQPQPWPASPMLADASPEPVGAAPAETAAVDAQAVETIGEPAMPKSYGVAAQRNDVIGELLDPPATEVVGRPAFPIAGPPPVEVAAAAPTDRGVQVQPPAPAGQAPVQAMAPIPNPPEPAVTTPSRAASLLAGGPASPPESTVRSSASRVGTASTAVSPPKSVASDSPRRAEPRPGDAPARTATRAQAAGAQPAPRVPAAAQAAREGTRSPPPEAGRPALPAAPAASAAPSAPEPARSGPEPFRFWWALVLAALVVSGLAALLQRPRRKATTRVGV